MQRAWTPAALLAVALLCSGTAAWAQTAPAAAPVAAASAALEPRADDTNAQRARSQPGNNAPFWRGVRESGSVEGVVNLPGPELGVLVQPFTRYPGSQLASSGEAWRQVRNQWILPYGGALLLISVLALALFYWRRGTLGQAGGGAPKVERFTPFERAAHWANAGAFVVLAVSGLVMAFGKFVLLPVLGGTLFGWLTYALKTAHNLVGPLFAVSLLVVIATFIKDNLPSAADITWLRRGGGLFNGEHVPSQRFNAGEKLVFWAGVLGCGLVVLASGLVLDKLVPGLDYVRSNMQVAHMVHAVAAMLMMAVLVGHIYMGTLGVKGALGAMKTGWVDEAWAREHHELWYNDIQAGKLPAQRSGMPPAAQPAAGQAANA